MDLVLVSLPVKSWKMEKGKNFVLKKVLSEEKISDKIFINQVKT